MQGTIVGKSTSDSSKQTNKTKAQSKKGRAQRVAKSKGLYVNNARINRLDGATKEKEKIFLRDIHVLHKASVA